MAACFLRDIQALAAALPCWWRLAVSSWEKRARGRCPTRGLPWRPAPADRIWMLKYWCSRTRCDDNEHHHAVPRRPCTQAASIALVHVLRQMSFLSTQCLPALLGRGIRLATRRRHGRRPQLHDRARKSADGVCDDASVCG